MKKKHSNNFYYLFLSQLSANIGDVIYVVGILMYIYQQTKNATGPALVPIIITTGIFFSGIISPYIYQYLSKRSILLLFQCLKIIMMLFILFIIYMNNIPLPYLYFFIFMNSLFDGFTNPIKNSMIPLLEDDTNITIANAKMNTMSNIVQVGSWSLGGILLSLIGNINLVILTIFCYIISVIFIYLINVTIEHDTQKETLHKSFFTMLSINFKNKESIFLNSSTFIESFAHSVWVAAILLIYIQVFLKVETFWFGMINATFFLGLIFAGIMVNFKDSFFQKRTIFFVIYLPIFIGILNISFGLHKYIYIALVFSFIFGLLDEIRSIILHSVIQLKLTNTQLTNTYILNNMVYSFSFSISTLLISYIVDYSSVQFAFFIGGLAYFLVFVLGLIFHRVASV
ncbi:MULTISPECIES: MFS transporter [Staphylococcus]|jgi:MFS family permease|uniref:MFS transporter n=1 Tax=Staphylococcus warneri TaxID=1292 RepID=A0ABS9NJ04_STAWA|nr:MULTISPECIES: MFS transporter [Bacteria]MCR4455275.1 MFS transporter [Aeromonas salmonicida]MDU1258314.1 MFS transporter [Clostridium perfringens]MDU3968365.1 MFS transporter [Staphylococcus epidermidis]PAK71893.1 MFS transporter [Staphylococcus pasteuri]COR40876.1 major facilitator superfamily protein [Streptococcus pneumoniae]